MAKLDANRLIPGLYIGSAPPTGDHLRRAGIDVLVLAAEEYQPPSTDFPGVHVIHAPLDDADITGEERRIATAAARVVAKALVDGKQVLVTCHMGLNRSSLIAALATRMLAPKVPPVVVLEQVRRARGPWALSNASFQRMLAAS